LSAAQKWEEEGIKTVSTDEKTGIQALCRNAPDLPCRPRQVCKQEYEYTRHGTQCLIANWDVVAGCIFSPTLGDTRTEEDFKNHIEQTVVQNPQINKWCFVVDNLNTHQSEALVLLVAQLQGIPIESLGRKGKCGILKSMESRAAFLQKTTHRVHFVYTPKHCSWLNQIEIWFGILSRKLLRRGNFNSIQDLKDQILKFIDYFNRVLAKPFKWTYNGKPCKE
jgi:putative transposase